jgi:hypothetical protein
MTDHTEEALMHLILHHDLDDGHWMTPRRSHGLAKMLVAEGWRPPAPVLYTSAGLDALQPNRAVLLYWERHQCAPVPAVVRDRSGIVCQRNVVWSNVAQDEPKSITYWWCLGRADVEHTSASLVYPVTVLDAGTDLSGFVW